jgi:hypothetical protein
MTRITPASHVLVSALENEAAFVQFPVKLQSVK